MTYCGTPPNEIRNYLRYSPDTGAFTWTKQPGPEWAKTKIGDVAGTIGHDGYRVICFKRILYYAAHLAWWVVHGKCVSKDKMIDHKNLIRDDDRISNLRPANRSQNSANASSNVGASKYKGVTWHASGSYWRAKITVNRRSNHLGLFKVEEDAAKAYDKAAAHFFGEYARLNFPEPQNV